MIEEIWEFHKKLFKLIAAELDLPIKPGRFPFILVSVKKPGISQKEIAKLLNLDPSSVAITLKRMEKDDLVFRKRDEKDGRILRVFPTEKAKEIYDHLRKIVKKVEKDISSILSDDEKECFGEILEKLNSYLSRRMGTWKSS